MPESVREGYYLGAMDSEAIAPILLCAEKIRRSDKAVVEYEARSLKAHLKGADRINARYCAVIGENELAQNTIWVKDLVEKTESLIPLNDFFV